jgi:hypothetical protein
MFGLHLVRREIKLTYYYCSVIKKYLAAQHAAAADPRFATKTAQGTKASSFAPRGQALAKAQRENTDIRF